MSDLAALLRHIDAAAPTAAMRWGRWRIVPIPGGANNLLYRATAPDADYAIKLTVRDDRDRAGREYAALSALHAAGHALAPEPVLLDRERYRQPLVVQRWLPGEVLSGAPTTDAGWAALVAHYCALHGFRPADTDIQLPEAALNVASAAAGKALVREHLDRLPPEERPEELGALIDCFDAWQPPTWPEPPRAICRVDSNWRNFISCDGRLFSVDWENAGWGDPAFDLADLITHPAYSDVDERRWQWVAQRYASQTGDATAGLRIATYRTVMLVWWAVRWVRYLYEVPRGLDPRLALRPPGWEQHVRSSYARYLALAGLTLPHGVGVTHD